VTWKSYIGSSDMLGILNKDTNTNLEWVPLKKHSLNRHTLDSTLKLTFPLVAPEGNPATAMPVEIYLPKAVKEMGITF